MDKYQFPHVAAKVSSRSSKFFLLWEKQTLRIKISVFMR